MQPAQRNMKPRLQILTTHLITPYDDTTGRTIKFHVAFNGVAPAVMLTTSLHGHKFPGPLPKCRRGRKGLIILLSIFADGLSGLLHAYLGSLPLVDKRGLMGTHTNKTPLQNLDVPPAKRLAAVAIMVQHANTHMQPVPSVLQQTPPVLMVSTLHTRHAPNGPVLFSLANHSHPPICDFAAWFAWLGAEQAMQGS
jgi:hypothetical protein